MRALPLCRAQRPTVLLLLSLLSGCVTGATPVLAPLPEEAPPPSLAEEITGAPRARETLALRSGRVVSAARALPDIPQAPRLRGGVAYAQPPRYVVPAAGQDHFFGFQVTEEYAAASRAYLAGDGQGALAALDRVEAMPGLSPVLAWRAAHERVQAQLLLGRPDLAEAGLARTERLEIALAGINLSTRALRAEVRYWAGDLEGCLADAAQVARALGNWRLPVEFAAPPGDMHRLALTVAARIRSAAFLGMALFDQGRHAEALPWLELSDELTNDIFHIRNHPLYGSFFPAFPEAYYGRGLSLALLGAALTALDREPERARQAFERSGAYFGAAGFAAGEALRLGLQAVGAQGAGRMEQAAAVAGQALDAAARLDMLDLAWKLEALRGRALLALGRQAEAEAALRRAQEGADLLAGTLSGDSARARSGAGAGAGVDDITRGLADIDASRGDMEALYEDMERGRARAFVALLAHRALDAGREPGLVSRLRVLDREILAERRRKLWARTAEGGDAAGLGRERQLLNQRQALAEELSRRDPDLAEVMSVRASTLARARAALAPGQALAYALPPQSGAGGRKEAEPPLRLLWVTPKGQELLQLPLDAAGLRAVLKAFSVARDAGDAAAEASALAPLAQALDLGRRAAPGGLFVVPAGDWHFVPWGALAPPYPVAVLPTGGFVERRGAAQIRTGQRARAVLAGDPSFGGLLPQLPGALAESRAVGEVYRTAPLTGPAATEAALRQAVGGGADVLHLATHALFDPGQPLQSALFLTNGARAQALTLERLYAAPLRGRLTVLSACETGLGSVGAGDDLVGLARGFYLAGTSVLLSSLYGVVDEYARLFMIEFHRRLAADGAGGAGRAWLSAVRAVRAAGGPPSAQGAFVLGGGM